MAESSVPGAPGSWTDKGTWEPNDDGTVMWRPTPSVKESSSGSVPGAVGERPDPMDVIRELDALRFTATDSDRAAMAALREKARLVLSGGAVGERPWSGEPTQPTPLPSKTPFALSELASEMVIRARDGDWHKHASGTLERDVYDLLTALPSDAGGAVGEREEPLDVADVISALGSWPGTLDVGGQRAEFVGHVHRALIARLSVNEGGVAPVEPQEPA